MSEYPTKFCSATNLFPSNEVHALQRETSSGLMHCYKLCVLDDKEVPNHAGESLLRSSALAAPAGRLGPPTRRIKVSILQNFYNYIQLETGIER